MSPRIVSLVPSSTETLLALGVEPVACTRFCEQPDLAHVGGTKNPDLDAIAELAPDVVVFDREENRIEDHDAVRALGIETFVSDVTDLASALRVVDDLAALAEVERSSFGDLPPPLDQSAGPTTAFVPIWRRPWMTISAATYGASVLAHLGVVVVPESVDPYPTVDLADVAAADPELVLVPSEPYDFTGDHLTELAVALPSARIERIDGQDLFWWGARSVEAVSRLRRRLERPPTA